MMTIIVCLMKYSNYEAANYSVSSVKSEAMRREFFVCGGLYKNSVPIPRRYI